MNKKIIVLTVFILIVVLGIGGYIIINNSQKTQSSKSNNSQNTTKDDINSDVENNEKENQNEVRKDETSNKKVAVVYFSATGTTKRIAEFVTNATNADIFEIIPKQKYTSDDLNYGDNDTRATKEQNDKNSRPEIANNIDISNFDMIFIGYPIWWGNTPRIIQTFMENHELDGKTMIPFCTSGSSDISQSENTLKTYKGINWISGKRFSSSTAQSEVTNWVNSLNY